MENKIEIQEMNMSDYEQIKDILQIEFDEFWTPSVLKSELESKNSKYVVAKLRNEIIGFAGIIISPVNAEITNIVVRKDFRRKGVGSNLLNKLIEMSKENGKDEISLEVNEKNECAIDLYEKNNFEILGRRKKYYKNQDDAIIMTKKI